MNTLIISKPSTQQPVHPQTDEEEFIVINRYLNADSTARPEGMFVNLTALCREFGKHAGHFLALRQTKNHLEYYAEQMDIPVDCLVVKTKGSKPIAWAHRQVALDCARWLSAHFALWYNNTMNRTPGDLPPNLGEVLQLLAAEARRRENEKLMCLKEFQRLTDPERIPGMATRRRVRAAVVEEEEI